jgi:hypothetical protein
MTVRRCGARPSTDEMAGSSGAETTIASVRLSAKM